jgi:photosystem II protein
MTGRIEFFQDVIETSLPIIRLTKSKNKTTGTATFIFIRPKTFNFIKKSSLIINEMCLIFEQKKIKTTDIKVFFLEGKPFLIKGIFLLKNSREWFDFLNFMKYYSRETGLYFTEILF